MGRDNDPARAHDAADHLFTQLRGGQPAVWLNPAVADLGVSAADLDEIQRAADRFERFEPLLSRLFPGEGWSGRIESELFAYAEPPAGLTNLWVKGDHALPMTGSIKARGGVHELLCYVERIARDEALLAPGESLEALLEPEAQAVLNLHSVAVASTGNLGFSIGLVARAMGLNAEIHMSIDAKAWKKARLRALDAKVIEHECHYTETVARARVASTGGQRVHFIDDERSRDLFFGYAVAAREVASQLAAQGVVPNPDAPIVVYLPCGVGGAPGGVLFGLKALFGAGVLGVFVEPTQSACLLAAMAMGGREPVSIYELGLRNDTIADGLAVPVCSKFVLEQVGPAINAVVAIPDNAMLTWMRHAHGVNGLRLEPSAASGLAAVEPFLAAARAEPALAVRLAKATHLVWTTGGAALPDDEFHRLLDL
ncbi:D-serine ammonia-lyase [Phenylobacterium sp.]|uniref:D-serine ammonia-lyase n=1 Tax=Phenylobacterium sp. TaxID=1871053 RepID=UPI00272F72C2|nr:D-serine ammonia-lyase [Phenylobacterium sp.]MDP1618071.1 D-serine ammonia-lyase [Phenylobacterium sp.]MDP1987298.1 D-serine ammonia-lyase [Phenylobacterium sp.]